MNYFPRLFKEGTACLQLDSMPNYKAMQSEQLIKVSNSYTYIHGHDLGATCKRYRESQHAEYSEKGPKSWVPWEETDWRPRRWHFPSWLISCVSLAEITVALFLRIILFFFINMSFRTSLILYMESGLQPVFDMFLTLNCFVWNFIKMV